MDTITAKGKKDGQPLEVICIKNDAILFWFNKHKDIWREREIKEMMKRRYLIAGTYTPEEQSMLNVLNVLLFYFFDEKPDVQTTGITEVLPCEENVVY